MKAKKEKQIEVVAETTVMEKPVVKRGRKKKEEPQIVSGTNGVTYEIVDAEKKIVRKVYKHLEDLEEVRDLLKSDEEKLLEEFKASLKRKFPEEDVRINKRGLLFRGYSVSLNAEDGFAMWDCYKKENVEWDDVPTPKELVNWFNTTKRIVHTKEENMAAIERGKQLLAEREIEMKKVEMEVEEIDFDKLRGKVLNNLVMLQTGKLGARQFDILSLANMIPFRRWKINVNLAIKEWKTKQIRYKTLINKLVDITRKETFKTNAGKTKYGKFAGTLLPDWKTLFYVKGLTVQLDGQTKKVIPFMLDYLFHFEPKAMYQFMNFVYGNISLEEMLVEPIKYDPYVTYNIKDVPDREDMLNAIKALYVSVGMVSPLELLFDENLEEGDSVMFYSFSLEEWVKDTVAYVNIKEGTVLKKSGALDVSHKYIAL